jgi:hypothetical protein
MQQHLADTLGMSLVHTRPSGVYSSAKRFVGKTAYLKWPSAALVGIAGSDVIAHRRRRFI